MTEFVIYNAHARTGEFTGVGFADPDPLTAGSWLLPANAYPDAPPVALAGTVAVRGAEGWELRPDHRGAVYSTLTGQASEWDVIGDLPEHLTDQPRPSPTHVWSNEAWVVDETLAAAQAQARINTDSLAYLAETDWYVTRNQETGASIPAEVLERRAAARLAVNR